jgi:hypothetical protein
MIMSVCGSASSPYLRLANQIYGAGNSLEIQEEDFHSYPPEKTGGEQLTKSADFGILNIRHAIGRGLFHKRISGKEVSLDPILTRFPPKQ